MPDDEGYPTVEDLEITRDADGNINPIEGETPTGKKIKIRPMPTGDNEKFFGNLDDPTQADHATKAQVLSKYYVKPDINWDEDDVRDNVDRATVNELLVGLMLYSGYMRTSDVDVESMDELEAGGTKNNL